MNSGTLRRAFPRSVFDPRRGHPAVVRAGMLAEYLLSRRRRPLAKARPQEFFRLLSMSGRNHLLLLRESLYSYCRIAGRLPPLEILNDGSLGAGEIESCLSFWPAPLRVLSARDVWAALEGQPIEAPLRNLAAANPLGLKLAFILARSAAGPQLFADSDILWFRDPAPSLAAELRGCAIAVGREASNAVSRSLAAGFAAELLETPGPNTGCVWSDRDLTASAVLPAVLQQAAADPQEEFNEQTILGILAVREGRWLPDSLCLTAFADAFHWRRQRAWRQGYCARHYVRFMRHQFYRDAIHHDGGWLRPAPT